MAELFRSDPELQPAQQGARESIVDDAASTAWTCCRRTRALDELQGKLESRHKIYKLREALAEARRDYDRIYIDTPPALNFYTRSALIAAGAA